MLSLLISIIITLYMWEGDQEGTPERDGRIHSELDIEESNVNYVACAISILLHNACIITDNPCYLGFYNVQ